MDKYLYLTISTSSSLNPEPLYFSINLVMKTPEKLAKKPYTFPDRAPWELSMQAFITEYVFFLVDGIKPKDQTSDLLDFP